MKALSVCCQNRAPAFGFILVLVLIVIHIVFCFAHNAAAEENRVPFSPGERLTFELKWGFIPAGEAVLEVLPVEIVAGKPAYHFVVTATSNAFIDVFYTVRDRVDAYADLDLTHSVLYKKKQREGKTRRDVVVNFDWEKMEAQYSNFNNENPPIPIFPGTLDPLSAFFYVRHHDLKENIGLQRPVTDGKKCVIGIAHVKRKERIKVPGGTYDTYVLEPELKHIGGVFEKSKDARIRVWVTADHRRLPVRIRSKVKVGSFTGELVSATGIGE